LDEEISNPEREAATKVTTEAPVCKKCLRMKTKPDVIGRMYNCKSTKSPNYGKLQCNGRVGDLWLNHLI
jgi:hypothetical protein